MSLASHTSHAAHSVQMSAWKCWRQEKKMKQAIRCSKSLLSRQNKEKKKTPASPTYPCRTPTRFLGKTTVSCQGLADNLNLPVQSNHQTQQNKQHRSKPFFFFKVQGMPNRRGGSAPNQMFIQSYVQCGRKQMPSRTIALEAKKKKKK